MLMTTRRRATFHLPALCITQASNELFTAPRTRFFLSLVPKGISVLSAAKVMFANLALKPQKFNSAKIAYNRKAGGRARPTPEVSRRGVFEMMLGVATTADNLNVAWRIISRVAVFMMGKKFISSPALTYLRSFARYLYSYSICHRSNKSTFGGRLSTCYNQGGCHGMDHG